MPDNTSLNPEVLLNTLRLLYVEDDHDAMQELSRFLRKRVSAITAAPNGTEALALARDQRFDVILTDLKMPEMDGLSFIKQLRNLGIQTPVIITSACSDSETILKAVDLGIVKYCVKPIDVDELLRVLARIAAELLNGTNGSILLNNRLLDRQQRLDAEKLIKSGYAHLLKNLTGKGPKEVHVTLGAEGIEITATEVLTILEASLVETAENASLVAYLRKILYTSRQKAFEAIVLECLRVPAILDDVHITPEENMDRLMFLFR